jgi:Reverse transcriptase (RNA-dependent DNA polymerase)
VRQVLKLKKALYGLKQADRAWNAKLVSVLQEHGLNISVADSSFFTLKRGDRRAFLLVYVDDGLVVGMKEDTQHIINILEVLDIWKIIRDMEMRTILLTQRSYTKDILNKTKTAESKPKGIPLEVNAKISKEGDDTLGESRSLRRSALYALVLINEHKTGLGICRGTFSKTHGGAKTRALVKSQASTPVCAQDDEARADARRRSFQH